MQELAGEDARIVRVMPNTPCLVGETASAMCLGGKATEEDAETVRALFSSVGSIVQVQDPAESPPLDPKCPACHWHRMWWHRHRDVRTLTGACD